MPPKLPPKRQWLQPVRSGWEWIKYWNVEAILIAIVIFIPTLIIFVKSDNWANWTGLGSDEVISITVTTRDVNGNVVATRTRNLQSGKTLWDWLGLLGVPLTLVVFGYVLQRRDQERIRRQDILEKEREIKAATIRDEEKALEKERAEAIERAEKERAKLAIEAEKERVESIAKEEVLQLYFDRLSSLLVDQNLLSIAVDEGATERQWNLLDTGLDIIRARTLAILRRFEGDKRRKGSVIAFLAETEIMTKTNLSLVGADISNTDLSNINLKDANLSHLNFRGSIFNFATLTNVNFSHSDLREAEFICAEITGVNFSYARLSDADIGPRDLTGVTFDSTELYRTELKSADFTKAHIISNPYFFSNAILCHSVFKGLELPKANFNGADLRYADFSKANLCSAYLNGAKLKRADFSEANLTKAEFEDSKLSFGILDKANLFSAVLYRSKLYKASLEFTLMIKTDLDYADVKEADFRKAILINVDLRDTKNITLEQLESCYICGVKLPSNITGIELDRDCKKLPKILIEQYGFSLDDVEKIISEAIT